MKTYTITESQMQTIMEALNFYAFGHHEKFLSNRNGEFDDWDKARADLDAKGFHFSHESYNGDEWYVECGRVAENAIQSLYDVINPE